MAAVLGLIFGLMLGFALSAILVIIRGFVLHKLWGWFIVTAFGLPSLGIVAAWGAALVLSFAVDVPSPTTELLTEKQRSQRMYGQLIGPFVVLLLGYLVHLFL